MATLFIADLHLCAEEPAITAGFLRFLAGEARKADGLDYDPDDERQQAFLSEITKYNIRSIE